MSQSILIYDGPNKVFRRLARWVAGQSDSLTLVPWRTAESREFFAEQFGDHLFAFVAIDIDEGVVRAGSETIGHLVREWGAPDTMATMAERAYTTVGGPLGRIVHGQRPADVDGAFTLTEGARPHVENLLATCSLATCATPNADGA